MTKDFWFLIIAVLVLVIFVIVAVIWFVRNSKDYTINTTVKGLYDFAQLNQRCVGGTGSFEENNLLPTFFEPQTCDPNANLTCILNQSGVYGICKSNIAEPSKNITGGSCYTIYDCGPIPTDSSLTEVFCSGGICTGNTGGGLYSACSSTLYGCNSTQGLVCTGVNGKYECLYAEGQNCVQNSDCSTSFCNNGVCKGTSEPAQSCVSSNVKGYNACPSGYGCSSGICNPLVGNEPVAPGTRGAFCTIPYQTPATLLTCNDGLICNFNAASSNVLINGVTGPLGYGLCDIPNIPISFACNATGGACVPPAVCYNGVCQAPLNNGVLDINYCGPSGPSSGLCGPGYTCDQTSYYCLPNTTGSLCNGSTGVCQNGLSCNSTQLGIFTPFRVNQRGVTGAQFGTWKFVDLPTGETGPSSESYLSTYQTMSIDGTNPITTTRIIYYPKFQTTTSVSGGDVIYYWYSEFTTDQNGNNTSVTWNQIDVQIDITAASNPIPFQCNGIKFTTGGNITLLLTDLGGVTLAYVQPFTSSGFTISFDLSTTGITNYIKFLSTSPIVVWDIDDTYNLESSIPVGVGVYYNSLTNAAFEYGLVGGPLSTSGNTVTNQFFVSGKLPTWVKYGVIPNSTTTPRSNFLFNGTISPNTKPCINNLNGFPTNVLLEKECKGVGAFFTRSNNQYEYEFYYVSNNSFRYANYTIKKTPSTEFTDLGIEGFTPDYIISDFVNTLSYGNIDGRLFTIVTNCS